MRNQAGQGGLPQAGKIVKQGVGNSGQAQQAHVRNFLDCVKSRQPTTYTAETMHLLHTTLLMGDVAIRLGRKLKWDAKKEEFIDDAEERGAPFYVNLWTLVPHAPLNPTEEQLAEYADLEPKIEDFPPHMQKYLRAAKEKVENELNIAAQIQKSILPSSFPPYPDRNEFELHAFMQPARYIGGDFYDFFFIDDNTLALVMADVSDKGVPAALFMMVSRTLINSLAVDNQSPAVVLEKANNIMCQNNDSGMFVTVFLAFYDVLKGKLTATNGGHSASLIIDPDGVSREWASTHGPALGFMEELKYKEETVDLDVGQTLFLYTDGVTEALSPDKELFGLDKLRDLLKRSHDLKLDKLCNDIEASLSEFQQGQQFDDITMLALKRNL